MTFMNMDNEQDNIRVFLNNVKTVLGEEPTRGADIAELTITPSAGSLPTANGAVTIANTATPTVVELLELCVEINAKLNDALSALRTHGLIGE